ncbi:Acetyltransferase GNAT family [Trichostrongylus colubriformis]|uniref:Acetyltransferase GNAT family n=1 Tax=Trichostrongylus colubriformis TaxID=6319 RepID=A0AAN8EVE1_TRICO
MREMEKSLQDIEIVLNPDHKHWMDIVEWCTKTEGWMFTAGDYKTWLDSFEKFWFYVGIDKESKEAVGSVSLSFDRSSDGNEEDDVYYVGMYYVRPEWRSSGLGTVLFDKVMEIGKHANMALNAVLKMSSKYASKYGFDKMPEYKHDFASVAIEHLIIPQADSKYVIKGLKDVDESKLIAYDIGISHRSRAKYLMNFISTDDAFTKVALDKDGEVVGIGCVRITYSHELCAGPLYADNQAVAQSLLSGILSSIPDIGMYKSFGSLYPAINTEAAKLFKELGHGDAKISPFTQCQFTKKIIPTCDKKVFAMIECACSAV